MDQANEGTPDILSTSQLIIDSSKEYENTINESPSLSIQTDSEELKSSTLSSLKESEVPIEEEEKEDENEYESVSLNTRGQNQCNDELGISNQGDEERLKNYNQVAQEKDDSCSLMQCDDTLKTPDPTEGLDSSGECEVHATKEKIESDLESGEIMEPLVYHWEYSIKSTNPICIGTTDDEYKDGNFLKGCKWAPDGSCILSNSDDGFMRLYNLPSTFSNIRVTEDWNNFEENEKFWKPNLKLLEGGLVYDYCWFPLMSSLDPITACFFTTASDNPIHLWDAFTGTLRATYSPFNHLDNAISAHSIAIDALGDSVYAGFDKCLRIFKLSRPGRECKVRKLKHSKLPDLSQNGIISTIAVHPTISKMIACGSFHGSIGVYGEESTEILSLLTGHKGGVTQIAFSNDGTKLYSGARKDSKLLCWDLRKTKDEYKTFHRKVDTNQRVYFDLTPDDKFLISGNTDGSVKIWETNEEKENSTHIQFSASTNCLNGISINKFVPVLATSSGQRLFDDIATDDSEDEIFTDSNKKRIEENKLKLWKLL